MTDEAFFPFLRKASEARSLSEEEMADAMEHLLSGKVPDIQIAGFLMALRTRGETIHEMTAAARAMRARAVPVNAPEEAVDTAGTGGDGAGTYNISTAAAIIAAGAGAKIAKHGNKAATSKSGSSDILQALGVNLSAPPKIIETCIRDAGVGFMFAAYHHQAVAHVARVRSALKVRTIFNLLGPLSNPAGAKRQLLGVFDRSLLRPLAEVLHRLGTQKAWIVHGDDGLDEITTTTHTHVCSLTDGNIEEFQIHPEDVGLPLAKAEDLVGGNPNDNAKALSALLDGASGAYRDIAILNAAATLVIADKTDNLQHAVEMAGNAVTSGAAKTALEKLVTFSNG